VEVDLGKTARVTAEGLRLGGAPLDTGDVTHVMAVINLSPESRNRHTVAHTPSEALRMARRHRDAGSSIIDLGGQSSHFETPTIAAEEELARVLPAVELLVDDGFLVSVDTWKPLVARRAVEAGAVMVNDTGGLADPAMREVVAETGVAAVVMYLEAPNPHEVGPVVLSERKAEMTARRLEARLSELEAVGIRETVLDPGIAISYPGDYRRYTRMQLEVIRGIDHIRALNRPVLVPIPRKREDHRVAAYITMALEHRADLIRVHDVEAACDLVALFDRVPHRR
jgi:dihydropteroate synthase